MINTEIFSSFRDKSRVLIFAKTPSLAKCLVHILNFHQKDFDFILEDNSPSISNQDFVILGTENSEIAAKFQPNIVLISTETETENVTLISNAIIPGGVVVFPEKLENTVETSEKFFRKLPFLDSKIQEKNGNFGLITEMGNIPVPFKDEILLQNLNGLKLICQQFGVLEEDFYEPLLSF